MCNNQAEGQQQNRKTMFEDQFHILYRKPGPVSSLVKPCHQVKPKKTLHKSKQMDTTMEMLNIY